MATKHTPGPWTFDNDWHRIPSIVAYGLLIASVPKSSMPHRWSHTDDQAANARLIAAAPELLEALAAVMREFFPHATPNEYPELSDARAAIAKATGTPAEPSAIADEYLIAEVGHG